MRSPRPNRVLPLPIRRRSRPSERCCLARVMRKSPPTRLPKAKSPPSNIPDRQSPGKRSAREEISCAARRMGQEFSHSRSLRRTGGRQMHTKSKLISRRNFLAGASSLGAVYAVRAIALPAAPQGKSAAATNVADFFRDFAAEWVRLNPNLATGIRYFSGEEQERLERQLTPETLAWRRDRIRLARRGLADLAKFDRDRISEKERVSAGVMQWQLEILVAEELYLEYTFPLEQFNGANVRLPYQLTVVHPLLNEKDADNYVAALGQVSTRMGEAIAEARAIGAKGTIPPRFILQATIEQMRGFVGTPPAQNPLVTVLTQ